MKKILLLILPLLLTLQATHAAKIQTVEESEISIKKEITNEYVFNFFADRYSSDIPDSYKYIQLNFKGVAPGSELEDALKRLVYVNAIKNLDTRIPAGKKVNAFTFYKLSEQILGGEYIFSKNGETLKNRHVNETDIQKVRSFKRQNDNNILDVTSDNGTLKIKKAILNDVYKTLKNNHYNKANLEEEELINRAIEGLTDATDDKFSVYFPATEGGEFLESLNGKYEGIGAYVDMEVPGELRIVSPISGSPAQKAGLKGGDIVTHVDGREIDETHSVREVISWIKGPADTTVTLTINRDGNIFDTEVTRKKIVIKEVEHRLLNNKTHYLQIKTFGEDVSDQFVEAIKKLSEREKTKRLIIDLRNNGGGYLDQVTDILSHFIPEGEPTAVVRYLNGEKIYYSKGYNTFDPSRYELVFLVNSGTASASEIMVGTLKDYFPNSIIIGEKTYGKGSVQQVKPYRDGSFLKYTVAKWYTGKNENGIDQIGITPDIELELDIEAFKTSGEDNQLEAAQTTPYENK